MQAIELLLASNTPPRPQENEVLRAIANDLADALPELRPPPDSPPGTAMADEVALLVRDYTDTQAKHIRTLAADHGDGPSLRRAWNRLRNGDLLTPNDLDQLSRDIEHDTTSRHAQHKRHTIYLEWREQTARTLARKAGPLGRLTHRPEDFYPQLDHEHLKVCGRCEEIVYPAAREDQHTRFGERHSPCHFCDDIYQLRDYTTTESEAYQ